MLRKFFQRRVADLLLAATQQSNGEGMVMVKKLFCLGFIAEVTAVLCEVSYNRNTLSDVIDLIPLVQSNSFISLTFKLSSF